MNLFRVLVVVALVLACVSPFVATAIPLMTVAVVCLAISHLV